MALNMHGMAQYVPFGLYVLPLYSVNFHARRESHTSLSGRKNCAVATAKKTNNV